MWNSRGALNINKLIVNIYSTNGNKMQLFYAINTNATLTNVIIRNK